MKRSFLTVIAAASVLALGACGGDDADVNIEPVEEVTPAPAPAPAPAPMPMDTTMMGDTLGADTTGATTTSGL
jgi:hypothetical protein